MAETGTLALRDEAGEVGDFVSLEASALQSAEGADHLVAQPARFGDEHAHRLDLPERSLGAFAKFGMCGREPRQIGGIVDVDTFEGAAQPLSVGLGQMREQAPHRRWSGGSGDGMRASAASAGSDQPSTSSATRSASRS